MPFTTVRKTPQEDAINETASRLEPKLRKAFLDAVKAMKDSVSLDKLTEALAKGDADGALSVLAVDQHFADALKGKGLQGHITSFHDAVHETFSQGAKTSLDQLPDTISLNLSFNLQSAEALKHIDTYAFDLIQQVSKETVESIRGVIHRAFSEGGHPSVQARAIRNSIGLTVNQEKAVSNYERALKSGAWSNALNRGLRDARFDRTINRVSNSGASLSPGQIDKMVDRYREKFVNYRANNIARTESVRASNVGQHEVWKQALDQGLLDDDTFREWIASGDDRTCDECMDLDGETAGLDEEFDVGVLHPPLHPQCRCTTALKFKP